MLGLVRIDDKWCGALLYMDDIVLLADTGVEHVRCDAGLCGEVEDDI